MRKEYKIKKSQEIDAVFKNKKSVGTSNLVIYQQVSDHPHFRFAISIGKKFGSAVRRNQAKRRINFILQNAKDGLLTVDFVIVVKPIADKLTFTQIKDELETLLIKGKILENKEIDK